MHTLTIDLHLEVELLGSREHDLPTLLGVCPKHLGMSHVIRATLLAVTCSSSRLITAIVHHDDSLVPASLLRLVALSYPRL